MIRCQIGAAALLLLPFSIAFKICSIHRVNACDALAAAQSTKDDGKPERLSPLPIFPLRKAVRVPTETLTLNLYEPRYIEMSRYILHQEGNMLFGALYSSEKPQIVRGAREPVVPLVEVGDVGVIFKVVIHEEAMIPTAGDRLRHRIRLEATGVGRFIVTQILQPGYSCGINAGFSPFILAEVDELVDNYLEYSCDLRDYARELIVSEANAASDDMTDFLSLTSREDSECVREHFQIGHEGNGDQYNELFSFASASLLREKISPQEMMWLLRLKSTRMRLESLIQVAESRQLSFQRFWS